MARQDIVDGTAAAATVREIDLSARASVRTFAAAFKERFATLNVLVNNAEQWRGSPRPPCRVSPLVAYA